MVDCLLEPELLGDLVIDVTLLVVLNENVCGNTPLRAFVILGKGASTGSHLSREAVEQVADKDRLAGSGGPLNEDDLAELSVCEGALCGQPAQGGSRHRENLLLGEVLLLGELVEGGGLEQRGVPDHAFQREELGVLPVEPLPHLGEDGVELVLGVVVALGVCPPVVELLDCVDAEKVLHHAILDVQCQRLVEVCVADDVLPDGAVIDCRSFGERVPVVARLGIRTEVLAGPRDDVVGLADIGEVLGGVAVAVLFLGVDNVNGGVVKDELGVLELRVRESEGVPIESPAVNLSYDGLWDEGLVAHG